MTSSEIERLLEEKVAEALGVSVQSPPDLQPSSRLGMRRRQPAPNFEDA